MTYYEIALIACASSTMALTAYPNHVVKMGWRTGTLFALPATKVTLVSALIAVALIVHVLIEVVRGGLPWWWLILVPASAFLGGGLLTGLFGRSTGTVTLIVSPATAILAGYLHFMR